jgi:hypothetical protein
MGFYIRRTVKAGPFRFNITKSGIGVSTGIPGFRVGTGPRGNYVFAGGHGFYYRASLGGAPTGRWPWVKRREEARQLSRPDKGHAHPAQPYRPSDLVLQDVSGATALSLEPTGPGDLIDQLNAAAPRFTWWWPAGIAVFLLGLILGLISGMPWALAIWVPGGAGCSWLYLNDQARRTVVLFYDLHGASAGYFASLFAGWDRLTECQRLWRIVHSGAVRTVYQYKTNAGVNQVVDRVPVAATMAGPKHLSTNIAIPSLVAGNAALYFLPDRILVRYGNTYSDLAYRDLRVSGDQTRFTENPALVPPDAVQVGQTWQYVNVKGGPDRRFKNNPLLPIMLYGRLELSSPQGLDWQVETSRAEAAPAIAAILRHVSSSTHECKLPALGRVVVGEHWTCPECGREWAGAAWPDGMRRGGSREREWERTQELRRHADEQNQAFLAGDDAGLYGQYPPADLDE